MSGTSAPRRWQIKAACREVMAAAWGKLQGYRLEVQTHGDGGELVSYETLDKWDGGYDSWSAVLGRAKPGQEIHCAVTSKGGPSNPDDHELLDVQVLYLDDLGVETKACRVTGRQGKRVEWADAQRPQPRPKRKRPASWRELQRRKRQKEERAERARLKAERDAGSGGE